MKHVIQKTTPVSDRGAAAFAEIQRLGHTTLTLKLWPAGAAGFHPPGPELDVPGADAVLVNGHKYLSERHPRTGDLVCPAHRIAVSKRARTMRESSSSRRVPMKCSLHVPPWRSFHVWELTSIVHWGILAPCEFMGLFTH